MLRVLLVFSIFLLIPPALAAPDVLPITGTNGVLRYDLETRAIVPINEATRDLGYSVWSATESTGYFYGQNSGIVSLDWGDIANDTRIGGLGWTEYTNSQASHGDNAMFIAVYANDNGWNTQPKQMLAAFEIQNIPGSTHPTNEYWGYIWRLEIARPWFTISGDDLDGDALTDFSYIHWFKTIRTPGAQMGPSIAGAADPNNLPPFCPGIENAYDLYGPPNFASDPNLSTTPYLGTYWFGGNPFAQFYWEMFAPSCPNAGESGKYCTGDISGHDCIVGLGDLAECLGTWMHSGDQPCDIYPPDDELPGDGIVDLQDLAEVLGQYGDNCN